MPTSTRTKRLPFAAAVLLAALAGPGAMAAAEETAAAPAPEATTTPAATDSSASWSTVPDTVRFRAGWMFADFNTEAQVGIEDADRGTNLNFEDIFNLPGSKGSFRLEGAWRFKPKHHLGFGFVQFDRSAARELQRDIDFGDTTYMAGARVEASIDSRFIYAAYQYDFVRAERVRFSGTVGISYMTLTAGLSANAGFSGNGNSGSVDGDEETSVSFPVPLFGLAVEGDITRNLIGSSYFRGLTISSSGLRGTYVEAGVGVDWYFLKNFGLGGAYDLTRINLKGASDSDIEADFTYAFHGPRVYLSFAF